MTDLPRICFLALNAYPVMSSDKNLKFVGGAEVQQSILARTLAQHGYQVSMICLNQGQPDGLELGGVKLYRSFQLSSGIPVLRFFYPRLSSIWQAFKRADADIYFQQCAGFLTGIVAEYCQRNGKSFIYAAGSNFDFIPSKQNVKFSWERWLYQYGIRKANRIVVQNPIQQDLCLETYNRESMVIPNMFYEQVNLESNRNGPIIWVGNMRRVKRPELFIELARLLPDYQFEMIGGVYSSDYTYYDSIRNHASTVPNLKFHGYVPYSEVSLNFDGASLLVCTSEVEGFPNTFLQAWIRGIPVISFFDTGFRPDGKPVEHLVMNLQQAEQVVKELLTSNEAWFTARQRAKSHFNKAHSIDAVLDRYRALFSSL